MFFAKESHVTGGLHTPLIQDEERDSNKKRSRTTDLRMEGGDLDLAPTEEFQEQANAIRNFRYEGIVYDQDKQIKDVIKEYEVPHLLIDKFKIGQNLKYIMPADADSEDENFQDLESLKNMKKVPESNQDALRFNKIFKKKFDQSKNCSHAGKYVKARPSQYKEDPKALERQKREKELQKKAEIARERQLELRREQLAKESLRRTETYTEFLNRSALNTSTADQQAVQRSQTVVETYQPSGGGANNKEVEFYINLGNLNKKIWKNPEFECPPSPERHEEAPALQQTTPRRINPQRDVLIANRSVINKITYLRDAFETKREQLAAKKKEYVQGTNSQSLDALQKKKQEEEEKKRQEDLTPEVRLTMKLQKFLQNRIKEKKAQITDDNSFLSITCPYGHQIVRQNRGDIKDLPKDFIPGCNMCKQPNIIAHDFVFRCVDRSCCDPAKKDRFYFLCRICALSSCDPPILDRVMKFDFHDKPLYRHVINNRSQWTCHSTSPKFQAWLQTLNNPKLLGRCQNALTDIVNESQQTKLQGYECRESDFDICLKCLLYYKDMKPYAEVNKEQRYEYKAYMQDVPVDDLRNVDHDHMIDEIESNSSGHHHPDEESSEDEVQRGRHRMAEHIELCQPRPLEEEIEILKGKPNDIFEAFQREYADDHIEPDLKRNNVKIRGYYPTQRDIAEGVIEWQQEVAKPFVNPFKIQNKHIQIIDNEQSTLNFMVVKTVEKFAKGLGGKKDIIKTLRIRDPQNEYRVLEDIALEQIEAYTYNEDLQKNHTSILLNGFTLYFFRRINSSKHPGQKCLQLYKYDILKRYNQERRKEKIERDKIKEEEHRLHDYYKKEMRRGKSHSNAQQHETTEQKREKDEEDQKSLDEDCLTKIENICFEEIVKEQAKPEDEEAKVSKFKDLTFADEDGTINFDGSCHLLFAQQVGIRNKDKMERPEPVEGQPEIQDCKNDDLNFLNSNFILVQNYWPEKSQEEIEEERKRKLQKEQEEQSEYGEVQEEEEEKIEERVFSLIRIQCHDEVTRTKVEDGEEEKRDTVVKVVEVTNQTNARSPSPVSQFFVSREKKEQQIWSEQEIIERRQQGLSYDVRKYEEIDLIAMDKQQYHFHIIDPPNALDKDELRDKDGNIITHPLIRERKQIQSLPFHEETDGQDVDFVEIKISSSPKECKQYYLVTEESQIILLHPNSKDEAVRNQTEKEIIKRLQDEHSYGEGNKKFIIQQLIRRDESDTKKVMVLKDINRSFVKLIAQFCRNYSQSQKSWKVFNPLTASARMLIQKNMFSQTLYFNDSADNSQVIVIQHNNCRMSSTPIDQIHQFPYHQWIIIDGITQQKHNFDKLFLNTLYSGVVSNFKRIMTSYNEGIQTKNINYEEKKSREEEEEQDTHLKPDEKKEKWVDGHLSEHRMAMRDDFCEDYVYLEGDYQDTYAGDPNEVAGTYNKKGKYIRARITPSNPQNKLQLITYHMANDRFVFLFQYDKKSFFFLTKHTKEILKLDASDGGQNCIIYNYDPIILVTDVNTTKQTSLDEIKSNSLYLVENVLIKTMDIVDNREKCEFLPFIACKCNSNPDLLEANDQAVETVCLNLLDFHEKNRIIESQSINVAPADMACLYPRNIQMCMISNVETLVDSNTFALQKRDYIPYVKQKAALLITYYLADQQGRFISKKFVCDYEMRNENRRIKVATTVKGGIKQFGQQEIITSKYEYQFFGFSSFRTLPYLDESSSICGYQLVIQGQGEEKKHNYQVLSFLDGQQNNYLRYESDVVQYGNQRFFNTQLSISKSLECFYTVISAQMKESVIDEKNFDKCERQLILQKIIELQYSMVPFSFDTQVVTSYDTFRRDMFFKTQEIFYGKSMCDVHLNDDQGIKQALLQPQEKIEGYENTLIDEILSNDPVKVEKFKKIGKISKNLICSVDFNFMSQIARGYQINANLAITALITKIFEINSMDYHPMLMLVLPQILEQESISIILPFFARTSDEMLAQDANDQPPGGCNLERFFTDERLPLKSDQEIENFQQATFDDINTASREVISHIERRDAAKTNERTIAVEHSEMDFQYMIIGQKLQFDAQKEGRKFVFDNLYLANLMIQTDESNVAFYEQDAIQKIIDYQFETTYKFFIRLAMLYVFFFVIPLLLIIFQENSDVARGCYIICYFTQLFFFGIELIQMRNQGFTAYMRGWNLVDLSGFVSFLVLMFVQFYYPRDTKENVFQILLILFLVLQVFMKLLFFMKIFADYGFLVQMIGLSILDMGPFMAFFTLWVVFFAIENRVLMLEFDESEYSGINKFIQMLILAFRNSIGDLQSPQYERWLNYIEANEEPGNLNVWKVAQGKVIIYLLWALWFGNIILMVILLLNFLIAIISQTYERVAGSQSNYTYKDRAEMNQEAMTILSALYYQGEVKMIVFTQDKSIWASEDNQWGGIVDSIKKIVQGSGTALDKRIQKFSSNMTDKLDAVQQSQQALQGHVEKMANSDAKFRESISSDIQALKQLMENHLKKQEEKPEPAEQQAAVAKQEAQKSEPPPAAPKKEKVAEKKVEEVQQPAAPVQEEVEQQAEQQEEEAPAESTLATENVPEVATEETKAVEQDERDAEPVPKKKKKKGKKKQAEEQEGQDPTGEGQE